MNTHRFVVTSALLFGITTTAHAVSLGGGPLGVNDGTVPVVSACCFLANQGASPITITQDLLYDQTGASVKSATATLDTCGATLTQQDSCEICTDTLAATVTAVHCRFVYTGGAAAASGVLEGRDADANTLSGGDLRRLP